MEANEAKAEGGTTGFGDEEDDIFQLIKKVLFRKPTKEQIELRNKKMAIFRQQQIEQFEINQTWNFVYGLHKPKNSKELFQLTNITYRNIWMEPNYLYNQIVSLNPNERFHDISQYALQWQPPGNEFRVMIPLNDPQSQVNAIKKMRFLTKKQISKILFYLTPIKGDMPLFAPNIHKSAYESFHDRSSVLKKLCEKYMQGVISVTDLHGILEAGYETWKMALYNILDINEQQYHRYLLKPPPKLIKKSIERQYLDEEITLQQYDDMKHPIRKAKKDEEALHYPRPYEMGPCIVCSNETTGLIKCIDCTNLVCIECIQRVFLNDDTSEGSFLLLHRKYCIRFGNLPKVTPDPVPEPAYLHLLRSTGIETTNSYLEDLKSSKRTLNDNDFEEIHATMTGISLKSRNKLNENDENENEDNENEDNGDDDDSLLTNKTAQYQQEIQKLIYILQKCDIKIIKCLEVLKEYQGVLDNPRRSQHLQERIGRLKQEKIMKIRNTKVKIQEIQERVKRYQNKHCNNYNDLMRAMEETLEREGEMDRLIEAKSLTEFHENEVKLKELKESQMKSKLILQYSFKR